MRCCGGRWLQRTVVQTDKLRIYWHCEQCGFVFEDEQE